jgi:hypothetical protein
LEAADQSLAPRRPLQIVRRAKFLSWVGIEYKGTLLLETEWGARNAEAAAADAELR